MDTLYKVSSNGKKVVVWSVEVSGTSYIVTTGYLGGKQQTFIKEVTHIANSDTLEEQAQKEAESLWKLKSKDMYPSIEEAKKAHVEKSLSLGGYKPMLAQLFDPAKKLKFSIDGALIQPKLDGCLAGNTKIQTRDGLIKIKDIVDQELHVDVMSYNETSGELELKPITNWFNNGPAHHSEWIYVTPYNGKRIRCTRDHKIMTQSGWTEASNLDPSTDKILSSVGSHRRNCLIVGTLLGDSSIVCDDRNASTLYSIQFRHTNIDYFNEKVAILNLQGSSCPITTGYGSPGMQFRSATLGNTFPIDMFTDVRNMSCKDMRRYVTPEALAIWISDDGSIHYNNGNQLTPRLSISTHRYTEHQLDEITSFFEKEYQSTPHRQVDKRLDTDRSNSALYFTTKDTLYILNILRSHQVRSMSYKFYFPALDYIKPATDSYEFVPFATRNVSRLPPTTRYDVEVEDNHNYCADGTVVHNCRMLARKIDNEVTLSTRSGAQISTVSHIEKQLESIMNNGEIFDGELYNHDMSFEDITSLSRSTKNTKDTSDLQYYIYDFPRIGTLGEMAPYKNRLDVFQGRFDGNLPGNLVATPTIEISSLDDIKQFHLDVVSNGYEGAMLRDPMASYENKRSQHLLKVKHYQDAEYEIIGVNEGKGKLKGHAGSFSCKTPDGKTFDAKLAGDTGDLVKYLEHPEKVVGRMLNVKFFSMTKHGIPRFPIGQYIRDNE